jgi:hypothetical protein
MEAHCVLFEECPRRDERDEVTVDLEFVLTGVVWDGDDVADVVATVAESLADQFHIDEVFHGKYLGL